MATVDLKAALAGVEGDIGLMKVDCEGGEYDIVEQMTADVAARIARITFEIHDLDEDRNARSIGARLESLGYVVVWRPDPYGRQSLHHALACRRTLR